MLMSPPPGIELNTNSTPDNRGSSRLHIHHVYSVIFVNVSSEICVSSPTMGQDGTSYHRHKTSTVSHHSCDKRFALVFRFEIISRWSCQFIDNASYSETKPTGSTFLVFK